MGRLKLSEAAKALGLHPKALQRMDVSGKLPAKRTTTMRRYWLRTDIEEYMRRGRP